MAINNYSLPIIWEFELLRERKLDIYGLILQKYRIIMDLVSDNNIN